MPGRLRVQQPVKIAKKYEARAAREVMIAFTDTRRAEYRVESIRKQGDPRSRFFALSACARIRHARMDRLVQQSPSP
jgi:hypothetical protein